MDRPQIAAALEACARELDAGQRVDLKRSGFWRAVDAVKRDRALVEAFAPRIADIDRRAFLASTPLVFPGAVGVAILSAGLVVGLILVGAAFPLSPDPLGGVALLLGAGALIGTTHGLAHLVVGRLFGMRFTHWYSRPPAQPQPGFKVDYATYLRASADQRAWMHASGAIVTKLVPFVLVPVGLAARAPGWAIAILVLVGLAQIATDVLFSVRASDWKKFLRERRYARQGVGS